MPADAKVELVKAWEQEQVAAGAIPPTTKLAFGGADEQIGDTNAFIVTAFGMALFLIFFILLLEYNSFWQVFVTISTVIMSLAGVFLGLMITGMSFSAIMTGLGIVALAGIVVKNGIVLTDTYNHYTRDDGVEPIKAMLLTMSQRVRPVLLTATVTSLGVIPMAINVEFDFIRREIVMGGLAGSWFTHLSAALVSGLFVSTALTLVMVPVMIVAPKVAGHQFARFFLGLWHLPGRLLAHALPPACEGRHTRRRSGRRPRDRHTDHPGAQARQRRRRQPSGGGVVPAATSAQEARSDLGLLRWRPLQPSSQLSILAILANGADHDRNFCYRREEQVRRSS